MIGSDDTRIRGALEARPVAVGGPSESQYLFVNKHRKALRKRQPTPSPSAAAQQPRKPQDQATASSADGSWPKPDPLGGSARRTRRRATKPAWLWWAALSCAAVPLAWATAAWRTPAPSSSEPSTRHTRLGGAMGQMGERPHGPASLPSTTTRGPVQLGSARKPSRAAVDGQELTLQPPMEHLDRDPAWGVSTTGPAPSPIDPQVPQTPQLAGGITAGLANGGQLGSTQDGTTRVKFETQAGAVIVPVRLHGPSGRVTVRMVFDTGATFSALSLETLERLGVPLGSAEGDSLTISGKVRSKITVVDRMDVGTARVDGGLLVSACDACDWGEAVGLLGLNFSRHFRVTVDHERGELVLQHKALGASRLNDIRPFVRATQRRVEQRGDRLSIEISLHNTSPRQLTNLEVALEGLSSEASHPVRARISSLGPGEHRAVVVQGTASSPEASLVPALVAATW